MMYKSIFKTVGVMAVAAVFCVGCGGGNRPPELVSNWVNVGGDKNIEKIELLKDGTGSVNGAPISWKVENKRLAVLPAEKGFTRDYNVSGYELTIVNEEGNSAIFVKKENLEEFEAKQASELANIWVHVDGDDFVENMELFKDGTGLVDELSITWKAENKRLIIYSTKGWSAYDYSMYGYELTIVNDDGDSAIFVKRGKEEEFEAKQEAELAKKEAKQAAEAAKRIEKLKSHKYTYTGRTVKIGSQTWTAENINNEGGGVCYDNDPSYCAKYGRLFTWGEALIACPSGWRLPSDDDWTQLVNYAGGEEIAGERLKSTSGWDWNNFFNISGNGTDDYGFSALPSGHGDSEGDFYGPGSTFWWSATEDGSEDAWRRGILSSDERVFRQSHKKGNLYSVRCVKNN